jgi:hypothetical protein
LRSATDPLCRAPRTKIILKRQLADLRVQRLHIDHRSLVRRGGGAEYARGAVQELGAPLRDLVRVNVELLGQLRQRPLASEGSQRHPIVGKSIHWIDF